MIPSFSTASPPTTSPSTHPHHSPCPSHPPSPVRSMGEPSSSLEVEIEKLDQKYIEIERLVLKTIKAREVPLSDVVDWIRFPPTSLRTQFADFLRSQARLLSSTTNIDELFVILSSYWNLFHPALLEHLVNKLGDESLKARMNRTWMTCTIFVIEQLLVSLWTSGWGKSHLAIMSLSCSWERSGERRQLKTSSSFECDSPACKALEEATCPS